jgi:hypothetical protein
VCVSARVCKGEEPVCIIWVFKGHVTRVYRYSRGSEPARDVMGIWARPWMLQVMLQYARNRSFTFSYMPNDASRIKTNTWQ